jgi:hypothetical protein
MPTKSASRSEGFFFVLFECLKKLLQGRDLCRRQISAVHVRRCTVSTYVGAVHRSALNMQKSFHIQSQRCLVFVIHLGVQNKIFCNLFIVV